MIFITYDFYETRLYDTHFRAQDTYSSNCCTLRDDFRKTIQTYCHDKSIRPQILYVLLFDIRPHKI